MEEMIMKKQTATAVIKTVDAKSEEARTEALFEVRSLKKDLVKLEKDLSSKKCTIEDPAFDLVHSAFEIFRHTQVIVENRKLNEQIELGLERYSYKEFLDSKGARVLKKPEGWHWISPAGEMHFLGESSDAQAAAEKLESIMVSKPKKAAPKKAVPKKIIEKKAVTKEGSAE